MLLQVSRQLPFKRKLLVANITLVSHIFKMLNQHVGLHPRMLGEQLTTNFTFVSLVAAVNLAMSFKVRFCSKTLPAALAHVRSIA